MNARKANDTNVRTEVEDEKITAGLLGTEQQQLEAINMAYGLYAAPLASFIRESVAPTLDPHEVATAVNDTFLGLAKYAARRRFSSDGALTTLLFSMARFKAYDQLRQKTTYQRHHIGMSTLGENEDECNGGMNDEEFASHVAHRLAAAPQIADPWKRAADEEAANETIRQFRLWIGTQSRLQRKVAEALLTEFGEITNEGICDRIAKTGQRPSVASVKSARSEITRKFETLMKSRERITKI